MLKRGRNTNFAWLYYPIRICLWYNIGFPEKITTTGVISLGFIKAMNPAAWIIAQRWGYIQGLYGGQGEKEAAIPGIAKETVCLDGCRQGQFLRGLVLRIDLMSETL